MDVQSLFQSQTVRQLKIANRIVLPPMGVHAAENGVPGVDVAHYYRLRAEGGAGLIITEGVSIDHPAACPNPALLRFDSAEALAGWGEVVRQVHTAGGKIIPELFHQGFFKVDGHYDRQELTSEGREHTLGGPSGIIFPGNKIAEGMSQSDIDEVIDAYARGAQDAKRLNFDGVHLHGGHGYLIDQFFWEPLNQRTDGYGGSMANRTRFGAEVVAEIRRRVGPDFPIFLRISQWKLQDYSAQVVRSPQEMEEWLAPLADAGVDVFDCSQRRFWEPTFEGSDLNLAGWAKKVTGKPTITIGSVGLDRDITETISQSVDAATAPVNGIIERLERNEFDLVAVGRGQIADPNWSKKVQAGMFDELVPFAAELLDELRQAGIL